MIKSEKKTPVPVKVYPKDIENIKLSKSEFVAKRKKQKERDALVKAFTDKIDAGEIKIPGVEEENTTKVHEKPIEEPKLRGRKKE